MTLLAPSQRPHIAAMQNRLTQALSEPQVYEFVMQDMIYTLTKAGLDDEEIPFTARLMLDSMRSSQDIETTEEVLRRHLARIQVNGCPFPEALKRMLAGRAQLIFGQIEPYLREHTGGKIIDIGCGDGQVTDLVYRNISKETVGFDVRLYPAPGLEVSLFPQASPDDLQVADGYFDVAIMTNVLHHEAHNENLLKELARVVRPGGRAIIIETVPLSESEFQFERTFVNDYVYNRIFHAADVPVPGTYETAGGWVRRFDRTGFDLAERIVPLGYDQPLIRDPHVLYVLKKAAEKAAQERWDVGAL